MCVFAHVLAYICLCVCVTLITADSKEHHGAKDKLGEEERTREGEHREGGGEEVSECRCELSERVKIGCREKGEERKTAAEGRTDRKKIYFVSLQKKANCRWSPR